jgi:hypothetical protein
VLHFELDTARRVKKINLNFFHDFALAKKLAKKLAAAPEDATRLTCLIRSFLPLPLVLCTLLKQL